MLRKTLAVVGFILWVTSCAGSSGVGGGRTSTDREVDLTQRFEGVNPENATFVVLDYGTGVSTRFNPARAERRFLPGSTFKIANALIALETGVVDGPEHLLEWDGEVPDDEFWPDSWSQDHTLRSAMANSVVWYYQELARRIGSDRMRGYLEQLKYGNSRLGTGVDSFWLDGDLAISADEQVDFLRRLYAGELDVSARSMQLVNDLLLLEDADGHRIFGKTGTVAVTPTRELAWLVGYVEQGEDVSFFALNVEGEEVWERWGPPSVRLRFVKELLTEIGTLPEG